MATIYLIRHGRVEWNINDSAYVGSTDLPLDSEGEKQASQLAERLKAVSFTAVYSSKKQRSVRTAQIIAEKHNLPVSVISGLEEMDYGQWEGLSPEQIKQRYGDHFDRWKSDPENVAPPDGETLAAVRERVLPVISEIILRHPDQTVALVAHKTVNRMLICHWLDMGISRYKDIGQDNVAVNIIRLGGNRVAVETVNDVCHTRR